MKHLLIALLFLMLALPGQVIAQDSGGDCEPEAVKAWLIGAQTWFNALSQTIDTELEISPEASRFIYHKTLFEVGQLPRPACADHAMLVLYQSINDTFYGLMCIVQLDTECTDRFEQATASLDPDQVLGELETIAGISMDDYQGEIYPDGWNLETELARFGGEETEVEAEAEETPSGYGSRSNPYPMEEWASFSQGNIRVAAVNDNYSSDSYTPDDGFRFIAIGIEWECVLENDEETCKGWEIESPADYVTPEGNLLGGTASVYEGDNLGIGEGHEAYSGATITGTIYFEIPVEAEIGLLRLELDDEYVFSALAHVGQ